MDRDSQSTEQLPERDAPVAPRTAAVERTAHISSLSAEQIKYRLSEAPHLDIQTDLSPCLDKPLYRCGKRAFDIVFSLAAIAVTAIPSAILCAAIAIESPGKPIYSQTRLGRIRKDGTLRSFTMLKFRSMQKDADARIEELMDKNEVDGAMFKMKDDPRVTKIGRFIRKYSIDEFPQFVNVLMGEMSIVGPRPPLPREIPEYTERDLERLTVKPGLTGPWQVSGRNDIGFDSMVDLDLNYIKERSFLKDLGYVVKTVKTMVTGSGA